MPSKSWLGLDSVQLGGPLIGEVKLTEDAGMKDSKRLVTTCWQDFDFLSFLFSLSRTEETYSVLRHNCRRFSQEMFDEAVRRYGTVRVIPTEEDCLCPVQRSPISEKE